MIDDTIPLRKGFHHFFSVADLSTDLLSKFLEFLMFRDDMIVFEDLNHR